VLCGRINEEKNPTEDLIKKKILLFITFMNNKIYSSELGGRQQCHNCKTHNNLPVLVLV
jgi:hypothetical protein